MAGFDCNSPEELVVFSTLITFLVSKDADASDLNVLGNLIVAIGGLILTWAAQKEYLETAQQSSQKNTDDTTLKDIKQQIKDLQEKCCKLEESCEKRKT